MNSYDSIFLLGIAVGILVKVLADVIVDTFFRRWRTPWPRERAAKIDRATARRLKAVRVDLTEGLVNREVRR